MSRKRAGLRDQWRRAVLCHDALSPAAKVTLVVFAEFMTDQGYVSVDRERIKKITGQHPSRTTVHIAAAKQAGLLAVIRGGWRGHAPEYVAQLVDAEKGTASRSPFDAERALDQRDLSATESDHLSGPKGDSNAGRQYARVTYVSRATNDLEQHAGENRTSGSSEDGSDGRAPAVIPLAAIPPTQRVRYAPTRRSTA